MTELKIDDIIKFGKYDWWVLDVQDGKALILSDRPIEKRKYDKDFDYKYADYLTVTWDSCDLRKYLNGEFYDTFSPQEKVRIVKTTVTTNNNPWWPERTGGMNTDDWIFLLSIEEVVQYFGDSGQLANKNPDNFRTINDQFNDARIALNEDGIVAEGNGGWWLRSPGYRGVSAAFVYGFGVINICGKPVNDPLMAGGGGVRPALWLELSK